MTDSRLTVAERADLLAQIKDHPQKDALGIYRYEVTLQAAEDRIEALRQALTYIEPERDTKPHWADIYRSVAGSALAADDAKVVR